MNITKRTLSILFIIDGVEFGGGERVFLQLVAGLTRRFNIFVAATPGGKFEDSIIKLEHRFFPVDMTRQFSLQTILQIKNIIQNHKIDLVHSQGSRADFYARIAGRMAGKSRNLCTIAMPVEGFDLGYFRKKIYRSLDCITERYVNRFIVVSDSLKKFLVEKRRIPESRIIRIYNGIELQQFNTITETINPRKEFGVPNNVPLVGAVGRMVWQKGFEFLVKAVPEVVVSIPNAKFLIVGDGPLREKLEALSKELRVRDKIIFAGFKSDIKEVLSAIDMLVVPSLLEGFPMITLEAMAMAKPIIATNIAGTTEQITNCNNGVLVLPGDPDALAKAVIEVYNDKEFAKKIGLAARKKVEENFSVEKMISETEKIYMSLLETY